MLVFYSILNQLLSKHAPIKQKRVKRDNQPDWFTEEIKKSIYERDKCHRNGKFNEYKSLRNKTTALIKKSKKAFFNQAIKENKNSSFIWKNLKDISHLNQTNVVTLPARLRTAI